MNKDELFEALQENDADKLQDKLKLIFEEKLEEEIWQYYNTVLEPDFKHRLKKFNKK